LTTENWKTIEGFEAYEVSDLGRVRRRLPGHSSTAVVGRILKASAGDNGYMHVCLYNGEKVKNIKVHRLVAEAFIPNPLNLPQINHTGKKSDNRACKLAWITTAEHGRDQARRGQRRGDGVYFDKQRNLWTAQYNPETNKKKRIGYFKTRKEAKAARDAKIKTL
jgi:hypothetical protein